MGMVVATGRLPVDELDHGAGFDCDGGRLQRLRKAEVDLRSCDRVRTERSNDIPFNYKEVIKGKNPEQNIRLQAGDTVVVP